MHHGRMKILNESEMYFNWIKRARISKDEKLNELVQLRNYLKVTYLLNGEENNICESFKNMVTNLVSDIDKYWWNLFTNGKGRS